MNLERTVTEWLRVDAPNHAPDEVLTKSLERVAVIPQMRVIWRRPSLRRSSFWRPLLMVAATLVALSLLASLAILGAGNRTPVPARTPEPTNGAAIGQAIEAGIFSIPKFIWSLRYESTTGPGRVDTADFQVPAGWRTDGGGRVFKSSGSLADGVGFQVGTVFDVYSDPCHWTRGVVDMPGGDDHTTTPFAASYEDALAALGPHAATSENARVSGAAGTKLTFLTPRDLAGCDLGEFRRWKSAIDTTRFQHRAGQTDVVWLLAAEPELLVIDVWYTDETPAQDREEALEMVNSLVFPGQGVFETCPCSPRFELFPGPRES